MKSRGTILAAVPAVGVNAESRLFKEKYLEALRKINNWATVSESAIKVGEMFPDVLNKANEEAKGHKRPTTGLREIAARISSSVSSGGFTGLIEVDESERPKRIRVLSDEVASRYQESELEADLEPLSRAQKIKTDEESLTPKERYRIAEFESIVEQLRSFFKLDFEFEHAKAILNSHDPGKHHPDNVQLLVKSHNRIKGASNWERFTIDEQVRYIEAVVQLQKLVTSKMGIELDEEVLKPIIERLRLVY